MKRPHVRCVGSAGLVLLAWTCAMVRADVFIPANTRTSASLTQPDRDTIGTFVNEQLTAIQGAEVDTTVVPMARDRLVEASHDLGDQCSSAYLDEYAGELNAALLPLLRGGKLSPRVRLNLAIAVYKVADRAQNARLAPVAVEFMQDPREDVCLWGMKAAGKLLNSDVQASGPNSVVLKAVLPAAQGHNLRGPIVQEAYVALQPPDEKDPGFNNMVTNGIPVLLKLFDLRVAMYKTALPDEPEAENKAGYAVSTKAVWVALAQRDKEQVMQLEATLLVFCTRYFSDAKLPNEAHDSAGAVIENCGETVYSVGYAAGLQSLVDAPASLLRLTKLGFKALTPAQVQSAVTPILAAIKQEFPSVKVPDLAPPVADAADPPATEP